MVLLIPSVCELYGYSLGGGSKASIAMAKSKYFQLTSKLVPIVYIVASLSPIIYFANEDFTKDLVMSSPDIWNISGLVLKYIGFYATRMGDVFGLPFICASLLVLVYAGRPSHIVSQLESNTL